MKNRPIKFRVWNEREKKFFYQEDFHRLDLALEYYETHTHVAYPQQYTGFKDESGREIYEGDFLDGFEFPVEFLDGTFMVMMAYDLIQVPLCSFEAMSMKIIGNIYENPELISKE